MQEKICRGFVESKGWRIVPEKKVWHESFSGRKEQRPVFRDILAYLDQHPGKVKYYVFRAIDRFTRGGSFSYETMKRDLSKRGVQMVDTYALIQPPKNTLEDLGFEYEWSRYSPSEIAELVMSSTAKAEVTNILTRMIGQEIRLTQQGYKIGRPEDGFLNKRIYVDGKKRTIQVPDPERATFYIEIFNMRASGELTDKEIVDRINAMGFRSKIKNKWDKTHERIVGQVGGHRLTVKIMQAMIRRPIYAGVKCEKWTRYQPIKAAHPGLVSIETWNRANRGHIRIVSDGQDFAFAYGWADPRGVKRNRHNPLFPYKNVILCPICRKPFAGSSSKGKSGKKFPAYHCSRDHKYFRVKKARFEGAVEDFLTKLRFSRPLAAVIETILIDRYRKEQGKILAQAAAMGKNVADLEIEKAAALKSFIAATSPVVKAGIEQEIEKLDARIKGAKGERRKLEITEADIHAFVNRAVEIMEHPSQLLLNPANARQQERLYGFVFDDLPDYREILNGTPKLSWFFRLSSEKTKGKSLTVRCKGLGWNTIESTILRWKEAFSPVSYQQPVCKRGRRYSSLN